MPSPSPLCCLCATYTTQERTMRIALACMVVCSEHACHDTYHANAHNAARICAGFFVGRLRPISFRRRSRALGCCDRRLGGHRRGMLLDADGASQRGKHFCRMHPRASSMVTPCRRYVQALEHFYTLRLMRGKILHDKDSKSASVLGDPHGLGAPFAFACICSSRCPCKIESVCV